MATIFVNSLTKSKGVEKKEVKGLITFSHEAELSEETGEWEDNGFIKGTFATHDYLPDIRDLVSPRYKISGITVLQESFGSEDFDIIYSFIANEFEVVDNDISEEKQAEIENNKYSYENDTYYKFGLTVGEDN